MECYNIQNEFQTSCDTPSHSLHTYESYELWTFTQQTHCFGEFCARTWTPSIQWSLGLRHSSKFPDLHNSNMFKKHNSVLGCFTNVFVGRWGFYGDFFWLAEKILRGKKKRLTNRKNCEPHCQPCLVHLGKIAFGMASWGRNVDTPQSPTGGFTLTCWKRMLGHLII